MSGLSNPSPVLQEWVRLVETVRLAMEGQRVGVDAVIALFNTYTMNAKLSYSLVGDVVAVELIDEAENTYGPYIAVILTTRQGLRIRLDFELRDWGIGTELSVTSLHQADCYCSG